MSEHLEKLASDLVDAGVEHVFGIPGSGPSLTVINAYEKQGGRFHLTHFEGSAAIMSGAVGKLSGKAGVCMGIKGPGLANMASGLAACTLDAFPVVSVTEAYPPGAPAHKSHKRLDHRALVSGVAKKMCFLSEQGPDFAELASTAAEECPGPVHLDIGGAPLAETHCETFVTPSFGSGDFAACLSRIERAERPVVIAGTLAVRLGLTEYLNRLGCPVFSTAAAKGAVDETLPHAAGVYTGAGQDLAPEKNLLKEADLIVGIGLRHNEVLGGMPLPVEAGAVEAVQLDPLGDEVWSGFGFAAAGFPSSEGEWNDLFAALGSKEWGADLNAKLRERMRSSLLRDGDMPADVFAAVDTFYNGAARLVMDTGIYCTVGEHIWQVRFPEKYLASGQGRYMGVGLPQAVGAAIYDPRPEVPTVLFTGDGGIGMYAAEVKLAVDMGLPLVVILMTDGGFGTLRGRCLRDNLDQGPLTVKHPSWCEAMAGMGMQTVATRTPDEVVAALTKTVTAPLFIEIGFDTLRYAKMTDGLR